MFRRGIWLRVAVEKGRAIVPAADFHSSKQSKKRGVRRLPGCDIAERHAGSGGYR
jgi:hypothetical protein